MKYHKWEIKKEPESNNKENQFYLGIIEGRLGHKVYQRRVKCEA